MSPQMLALLPILFAATAPKPGLLVSAKWLAANQHDTRVVVLHIARDQADYDKGHISGARFIPAPKLWTSAGPGVELPSVAYLDSLFESVGISSTSRIILYGEAWTTPRAFLALDYLGLGMPPGSPSLGELLYQGKSNVQAPWLGLTAFFSMAILLSLLIFVGEAVRDALDPRKTFRAAQAMPAIEAPEAKTSVVTPGGG